MNSCVGTQTLTLFWKKKNSWKLWSKNKNRYENRENVSYFLILVVSKLTCCFLSPQKPTKKQKPKCRGYVKSPDWSATKLRDAKLGVFCLALHWICFTVKNSQFCNTTLQEVFIDQVTTVRANIRYSRRNCVCVCINIWNIESKKVNLFFSYFVKLKSISTSLLNLIMTVITLVTNSSLSGRL
jgi:hypothetical protein